MPNYDEVDLSKIRTYSINDRPSKVEIAKFASPYKKGTTLSEFISNLPDILIGADFKALVRRIVEAHQTKKQVIAMMGAHVIKCGLSPLIIQLMEEGIVNALALNGAGIIHDTEIANWGITSEDVAEALNDGSFGMVRETADFLNSAMDAGRELRMGLGESVGKRILEVNGENVHVSVLASGYKYKVPVTVHVAIGTDIIHQHPSTNGATVGELSHRDFKIFAAQVAKLEPGSVVLNFGSAVILPEVFLKALTVARNLGHNAHGFTTANFDMLRHYRPHVNVVTRPTQTGGTGFQFTGHHEIMIPLLVAGVMEDVAAV